MIIKITSPEVLAILKESGWSAERDIDDASLINMVPGFVPSARVHEILRSFGGLTIRGCGESLLMEPCLHDDFDRWTRLTVPLIGSMFFPIAEYGPTVILLTDDDRVYADMGGAIFFVASTFEDSLVVLLTDPNRLECVWG